MSNLPRRVCAWILLGENNPNNTNYNDRNSCYQTLNTYGVYGTLDVVNVCFFVTVLANPKSCTIELGNKDVPNPSPTNPTRPTTQDYLTYVVRDAKAANPNMLFLATLGYDEGTFTRIFINGQDDALSATLFADNLVDYLEASGLDGFDVDWEGWGMINSISPAQFSLLFTAIRKAFDAADRKYYLTFSPAGIGSMVGSTVNATADWVNLQVYGGALPEEYIAAGVARSLLAYGAKFESEDEYSVGPHQSPQAAFADYSAYPYSITTQWRLNSGNYQTEQAYQLVYSELIRGTGMNFDDSNVLGAAGSPALVQILVRSGDVIDALQTTNAAPFTFNGRTVDVPYQLLQHGGSGGQSTTIAIAATDPITEVDTASGNWFGWQCVVQVTFRTRSGKVYGPYGTGANARDVTTTTWTDGGNALLGFKGDLVNVPEATGPNSNVIATLMPIWANAT